MAGRDGVLAATRRVLVFAGLALAGTVVVVLWITATDILWYFPQELRVRWLARNLLGLAAIYAVGRLLAGRREAGRPTADPLRWGLDGLDRLAATAMAGGLTIAIVAACVGLLATWVPHYLFWPWFRDSDTFATIAQSWDAGILPYRDIRGYNFPGAIYLFWLLGRVAGWGQTWALYAVDAAALVLLGVTLAAWSRRCLGGRFAGVAAYLAFLTFYLNLDYQTVAERDWHASLCVVLGLLILQAWPGRTSRIVSALLAAIALTIRPHVLLFLPAFFAAIAEGIARPDTEPAGTGPRAGFIRSLAEWTLAFATFTALAFSPLVIAGIADDLVRGLRIAAYGGPYHRADTATFAQVIAVQFQEPPTLIVSGLLILVLFSTRGASRRRAATWALALAAALLYRSIHPVQHYYLLLPQMLVSTVALATPMAWIADRAKIAPMLRLIALLALITEMSQGLPRYCDVNATRSALGSLVRGEMLPTWSPPGSANWFGLLYGRWYSWDDYRRVLIHLRATTSPTTPVANVLKEAPFPAINGPAARLSPFLAESGICWMLMVHIDLEPEFAAVLERSSDAIVVWAPDSHKYPSHLNLARLTEVIRKHYRLEARFGHIEVWRARRNPHEAGPMNRVSDEARFARPAAFRGGSAQGRVALPRRVGVSAQRSRTAPGWGARVGVRMRITLISTSFARANPS